MKTAEQIRQHIEKVPPGEPFTPVSLLAFGSRAAVDQTLSRLVGAGFLTRVTRGVFVRAKSSRYVGQVMPHPARVAEAVARATGAVVQVHGAEAARQFELTTQVPTQAVFYTSGSSKRFKMGNLEVVLKHVSTRKLALAGRPAGVALTALWYLGKEQVTSAVVEKIRTKLAASEYEALKSAAACMPAWMTEALRRAEGQA